MLIHFYKKNKNLSSPSPLHLSLVPVEALVVLAGEGD